MLEKALAPLNVAVSWHEFTSGLPLLEALQHAGLSINDITPAYLSPADGRAAFENGSVAAWVVWDPFLAAVQRQAGARVLVDGAGLAAYRRFCLAAAPFAQRRVDVLAVDAESLAEQQRIADVFVASGIIPRRVVVADSPVWRPA